MALERLQVRPVDADRSDTDGDGPQEETGMSAMPQAAAAVRPSWLSTSRRISLLVTVVAAAAAALYFLVVLDLPSFDAPLTLPWLVWVAAFAAGELLVVHIQLQRDSHSFSLTDLVLVAGLYLVAPAELITAQLAGAGLALVLHRRQFGLKLAFNLAQYALSGCLATILFAVLSQDDTLSGAWNWVAGLAAVAVSTIAAGLCIFAAISLSQGYLGLGALPRMLVLSMPFALAMAAFGLLAAQIAMQNPASLILLALPSVLLISAYRAYAKAREQQNNLRLLHEVTSLLYTSDDAPTALTDFLTAVRGAFRAANAELVLFSEDEAAVPTLSRSREGEAPVALMPMEHRADADGLVDHAEQSGMPTTRTGAPGWSELERVASR